MRAPIWRLTIDVTEVRITPGSAPNVWVVEGTEPWPLLEVAPRPVLPAPEGNPGTARTTYVILRAIAEGPR
jgi:hypothetical protein